MMTDCNRQMQLASENRQLRLAAQSIFNASINSQQNSYVQRTPDAINEFLIAGARYNGRMSNVRRFFCLFVTFDFLFTILMWFICIMISGANVQLAFKQQILHYKMKTSLFDIVMSAACRFTVLLLFYALLYMDHWCIVALSTTSTCAFLLSKVFLYDWAQVNQPVLQVLFMLSSFILVWAEVWFLDIKVIPEETQAREWYLGHFNPESAPLLNSNENPTSMHTENPGAFFTPMDSPDNSDEEDAVSRKKDSNSPSISANIAQKLSQEKIFEYKKIAPALTKRCYELITSENWKIVKITPEGDTISYMTLPKPDGKIFKLMGIMNISAEKLIHDLYENIESNTKWNKQIQESKKIYVIDQNTDLIYQATNSFGNGAISARDFIILRHREKHGSYYISSGISVKINAISSRKNFIRGENGAGCYATQSLSNDENDKCQFVWILNTNLKGWIPQKIVDASTITALVEFMSILRRYVSTIKD